ncbi:hypothetical protein GCM10010411_74780 [Actinomadura fulvescens]|uniref:HTH asnC-type domain-containing protein n=1 Tax=Actinomadura fulvescens TaxID=46160 RepID=A0ABN3QHN5_9ACTN
MQLLLDSGVVRVIGAVHPQVCGLHVDAWLLVGTCGDATTVAAELASRAAVYAAQITTGGHDVMLRVRTRDDRALAAEVNQIRRHPGVDTLGVLRVAEPITDGLVPAPLSTQPELDEVDWPLISILARDGRAPFTALSSGIGLSQAATRSRTLRLLHEETVAIRAVIDAQRVRLRATAGFGLQLADDADAVTAPLTRLGGVTSLALGWGPYEVFGEVTAESPRRLATSSARSATWADCVVSRRGRYWTSWRHPNRFRSLPPIPPADAAPAPPVAGWVPGQARAK